MLVCKKYLFHVPKKGAQNGVFLLGFAKFLDKGLKLKKALMQTLFVQVKSILKTRMCF